MSIPTYLSLNLQYGPHTVRSCSSSTRYLEHRPRRSTTEGSLTRGTNLFTVDHLSHNRPQPSSMLPRPQRRTIWQKGLDCRLRRTVSPTSLFDKEQPLRGAAKSYILANNHSRPKHQKSSAGKYLLHFSNYTVKDCNQCE